MDDKEFGETIARKQNIQSAHRSIMTDQAERHEFLSDPASYLAKRGVPLKGRIELSDRDKQIIKLVADPEVATIYASGDVTRLSQYLRANYAGLINDDTIQPAWTVADFEIAVEAVAVAVGVFVAPLPVQDDFSEVGRLEALHSTRLQEVEARIASLEAQLSTRGPWWRRFWS